MTEQPPASSGDDPDRAATAEEIAIARDELSSLAGSWGERVEGFDTTAAGDLVGDQRSLFRDSLARFVANRVAMLACTVMAVFVLLSILVPLDASWNPLGSSANAVLLEYDQKNLGPSWEHPFGTDIKGRDMWKRSWMGGRISLAIALSVALVILIIGVAYGATSGYLGGRIDSGMMRFLDSLYGLPYLPFAIIVVQIVQNAAGEDRPSPLLYMVPALSLTAWFTAARIARGQVLSLKENDFVEAAHAHGARWTRIVRRYMLPNILGVMVVVIALEIPAAILSEAVLSFIGLGVVPPTPSWGAMANEGANYFDSYPHLVWVPGLLIAVTVLCTIAIADGLRDALDPRVHVPGKARTDDSEAESEKE